MSASLVTICGASPVSAADQKQLILNVEHAGAGKTIIFIGPDCVKISTPAYGAEVVSKGPRWDVSIFHRKEKIIYNSKLENIEGIDTFGIRDVGRLVKPPIVKKATGKFCGLPATTYQIYKSDPPRIAWLLDDYKYPPQAAEAICRFFQLPIFEKIPLAYCTPLSDDYNAKRKAGERAPWNFDYADSEKNAAAFRLKTISARFVRFNKQDYDVPTGYTVVNHSMKIFLSNAQKDELTDLINEIGFQSRAGSKQTSAAGATKTSRSSSRK